MLRVKNDEIIAQRLQVNIEGISRDCRQDAAVHFPAPFPCTVHLIQGKINCRQNFTAGSHIIQTFLHKPQVQLAPKITTCQRNSFLSCQDTKALKTVANGADIPQLPKQVFTAARAVSASFQNWSLPWYYQVF